MLVRLNIFETTLHASPQWRPVWNINAALCETLVRHPGERRQEEETAVSPGNTKRPTSLGLLNYKTGKWKLKIKKQKNESEIEIQKWLTSLFCKKIFQMCTSENWINYYKSIVIIFCVKISAFTIGLVFMSLLRSRFSATVAFSALSLGSWARQITNTRDWGGFIAQTCDWEYEEPCPYNWNTLHLQFRMKRISFNINIYCSVSLGNIARKSEGRICSVFSWNFITKLPNNAL